MLRTARTITTASLCILFAACGGGSDGGDNTATNGAAASAGTNSDNGMPPSGGSGSSPGTPINTDGNAGSPGSTGSASPGNPSSSTGTQTSAFVLDQTARFSSPSDITTNGGGNLYVMDRGNQAIRKIAPTGEVSTLRGSYAASSRLAMDASGGLFVLAGTDIFKLAPDGTRTLVTSYRSGPGQYTPVRISLDAQGRLYVMLEYRNLFQVERIAQDNSRTTVYAFDTYGEFVDFASDAQGNLAVAYVGPAGGIGSVTLIPQSAQPAQQTSSGLTTRSMQLNRYGKILFDTAGNLYIADAIPGPTDTVSSPPASISIAEMRVAKMDPSGNVTTVWSGMPDSSSASSPTTAWNNYIGIAVDADGAVYMTDPFSDAIYKIGPSGQPTLITGKPGEAGSSD